MAPGNHIKKASELAGRFLIKQIALQAGVGTATVDRVLHGRGNVRAQTVERVQHAIRELEGQAAQLAASGRTYVLDLIAEAPQTFIDALGDAVRSELPLMLPAVFRVRSDLRVRFPVPEIEGALRRAERLGSHGVILMAPDTAPMRAAVDRLEGAGVPVITLATDMPGTARRAYVGLDNARVGRTAAWIVARNLGEAPRPTVLVTLRNDRFRGEEERDMAFRAALAKVRAGARIVGIVEGRDRPGFAARVTGLAAAGQVDAVYSIGGSNRQLLGALKAGGASPSIFVGHDLDPDNRALLAAGEIDVLLYHDFREDIRTACRVVQAAWSRGEIPPPEDGAELRMLVPPMVA